MTAPRFVLDAHALIAFFESEPGANRVEQLLIDADRGEIELILSVVNLGEIWYSIARAYSVALAEGKIADIFNLPLTLTQVDWAVTRRAAEFKSRGGISYADCFAAALADQRGATLVTGDREFERVQGDVAIEWL